MRAEVISIGDELTSGQRLDTNSQWLSERLGELGVSVMFHTTVADDLAANVQVFGQAVQRADLVISSGGLGPTADDLTRQAIAEMAGVELVQDDEALASIRALFARRKREMPPANHIQAMFPRGSQVIPNPHGSAPGIDLEVACPGKEPSRIFALPGVPAEMKEMWSETVSPAIARMQAKRGVSKVIVHHRIKCFGVGESDLEAMLPDLIRRGRIPSVGITVSKATITLRITAEGQTPAAARESMESTIATIHQCLGDLVYGIEDEELQDVVVRQLLQRGQTLALAECGTGGYIAGLLSQCDPAGEVFRGGMILRQPNLGGSLLGLPAAQSDWFSADFTAQLATRTLSAYATDYALAIGPFPSADSATTSPGEVHFAIATRAGTLVKSSPFAGHPEILKPRAAKQMLNFLRLHLPQTS